MEGDYGPNFQLAVPLVLLFTYSNLESALSGRAGLTRFRAVLGLVTLRGVANVGGCSHLPLAPQKIWAHYCLP